MGNSTYHRYMYPYILKYPGVVTLHEFCLAGFHNNYDEIVPGHFQKQVELAGEEYTEDISWAPEGRVTECVKRGLFLNEEVYAASKALITHSAAFADNKFIHYAPFPKEADPQSIRNGWDHALEIVVPGWLSDTKLNFLCLQAFMRVSYKSSILVFAGDGETAHLRKFAEENNIGGRVKFTGRLTNEEYGDIIREADIGVILRKAPTNGETSAALFDLLAAGVPTITSNVGSLKEIPDSVTVKVDGEDAILIGDMMDILLRSEGTREHFGKAGRKYVEEHHNPMETAKIYSKVILSS